MDAKWTSTDDRWTITVDRLNDTTNDKLVMLNDKVVTPNDTPSDMLERSRNISKRKLVIESVTMLARRG